MVDLPMQDATSTNGPTVNQANATNVRQSATDPSLVSNQVLPPVP